MSERAALITGASSGIGLEIARTLGGIGYRLTVSGRRTEKLEAAADELREAGFEVEAVAANVADEEQLRNVFAAHRDRFGRLDVLVNNAGIGIGRPIEQIETKHLDLQLAVNFRATVLGTREGLPMLREAGAEHGKALIVNLASFAGHFGQPVISVYGATKAAIINFSEAVQKELGEAGIQVTALCPGFVDTAMSDFVREQIPGEKMMQPADVAAAVRFLLETSPNCLVPKIVMARSSELAGGLI